MRKLKNPIVKKIVLILLIVVLSFSLLSVGFSVIFFSWLFPRQDYISSIALNYDDVDSAVYPREEIELYSGKNRLSAYRYDAKDPKALVIIAGGIGSDCDAHLPEILYFLDNHYSVLCYSCTGVGESEGGGVVGLTQPALDLSSALDYVETLSLPVVIYGHSAGAHAAALFTDERDIKACVCIAGFDTAPELMLNWAEKRVGILADIEYPFMCLQNFFLFGERGFESASESLLQSDVPVLLVTGEYDEAVPYSCSVSSHIDKLGDPDVTELCVDSENRGSHTAIWLCEDSAAYRNALSPSDPIDKERANTLDEDFMKTVIVFFDKAVA